MKRIAVCVFALVTAGAAVAAVTSNLGTIGPVYPVSEKSFVQDMQDRAASLQQSGELAKLEREAKARVEREIRNPPPVPGISPTVVARTFYFDPTFRLDRNIADAEGRVLFPAGTAYNPLDVVSLSNHLFFFDGRDERQVQRAKAIIQQYGGRVKPILVAGSALDLMKRWKSHVFYDQRGSLTKRLGISHVPALVSQDGPRLRIDELIL